MSIRLHVLESPVLHGKPVSDPPVHVVWEPDEFTRWVVATDGLFIYRNNGRFGYSPDGTSVPFDDLICHLRVGTYDKVWAEEFYDKPPHNFLTSDGNGGWLTDDGHRWTERDELNFRLRNPTYGVAETPFQAEMRAEGVEPDFDPEFAIQRAQPGQDGFSEPVKVITGETPVIRVEGDSPPELESPDHTQVIPKYDDYMDRISDVPVERPLRRVDWETIQMPLVIPEGNGFFEGITEVQARVDSTDRNIEETKES